VARGLPEPGRRGLRRRLLREEGFVTLAKDLATIEAQVTELLR